MDPANWHDLGPIEELARSPLREVRVGRTRIALSYEAGAFGAISGVCRHVGGPLGEGRIEDGYVTCPWHGWKYHCKTGLGEPGYEEDSVPRFDLEQRDGHLWVNLVPATKAGRKAHAPHALERPIERAAGPTRVVGISTTVMDRKRPRYSTSDALLTTALGHAAQSLSAETRHIRLDELTFRACEGYYSKAARACTWPCSITQMDPSDQMEQVYEALVHWADVVLIATPIRWGSASSLYFKMAERLNCVQNQVTTHDRVLIRNKVASFIITGGQDNVQAVAGQALMFFAELGFHFPQFPFIAHSRGWSAEDMEQNVAYVKGDPALHDGARALVERAVVHSRVLLAHEAAPTRIEHAGRKANRVERSAEAH
jgi:nitrite reductase/ring-hydroxylating ferredoxin subunit/multimeric flavodoxin WrbA